MLNYYDYFKTPLNSSLGCKIVEIENLYLPTGRIFCCDPFLSDEVNAFDIGVESGSYLVRLCFMSFSEWGNRNVLSALIFSEQQPISWTPAEYTFEGQKFTTFRVDAGLACFMDLKTAELFVDVVDRYYLQNPDGNYYDDILAAEFKQNADPANPRDIGDWNLHYPVTDDPGNVAMFASGLGDGLYSAYWGLDADDQPVMLVADFGLLS